MLDKKDKIMKYIFFISALLTIILLLLITYSIFKQAIPTIKEIGLRNFILGKNWEPSNQPPSYGILAMILGSLYISIGAIIIGVPIGLLTAIYIAEYCPKRYYRRFKDAIDLLAGIPSIVYGFFGLNVLVPMVRNIFNVNGSNILTASILLGIMILPTIISISEISIKSVDRAYYEAALSLGANKDYAIRKVIVPAAKSGILSSIILGIGRVIGETMAVVMVAGNQPRMPKGILYGARSMTSNIVIEMGYAADLHRRALIATAAILFIFILIINLSLSIYRRKVSK